MSAENTLDHLRSIRRRARTRAHGGAWFPAAVIAALLLGSIALYQTPFQVPHVIVADFPLWAGLPWPQRDPGLSYWYWFLGVPAAFGLIAWWYRRRARAVGVTVAWPRVIVVGLGALVVLAVLAAVPTPSPADPGALTSSSTVDLWVGLRSPLVPLALALLALGLTERSAALAVAGGWIGLIAWWFGTAGMGRLPGWLVFVLDGFQGPGLGGTIGLFDRPGPVLVGLATPLVVYAAIRAAR